MRRYVDVRVAVYREVTDRKATNASLAEGAVLQVDIWNKAVAASQTPEARPPAAMLLLPALNEMIDITATRHAATDNHPPAAIFLLLGALSLVGALLVGYSMSLNKDRGWFHTVVFAAALSITVYVILDLELPRVGLIRVDAADQGLVNLRQSMK
jgi:hypothetical protein